MRKKTYSAGLIENARDLRKTMPPAERRLWFDGLRTLKQKFRRQRPIGSYIVDFYCAEARLIVELDGATHDCDSAQQYDAARTAFLESLGLRVIRFSNEDVLRNLEGVLVEIVCVVGERTVVTPPSLCDTSPTT
jgi:very-short-patch-repair endonuclease